jgi:hypothetical protein
MQPHRPEWGPLVLFDDTVGQEPTIARHVSDDGLVITFGTDRLAVNVDGGEDRGFARIAALSGAVSVTLPANLDLLGFLLVVVGSVERTERSEALLTCSLGHATTSAAWWRGTGSSVLGEDFILQCFTGVAGPVPDQTGTAPPLAPLPFTLSAQVRRPNPDEAVIVTVNEFSVFLVRASGG